MRFQIKVINHPDHGVGRVYLAEIKDAATTREVLDEVFRGRQAVGNANETMIRCGDDKDFYGVTSKKEIIGWISKRLKEENNKYGCTFFRLPECLAAEVKEPLCPKCPELKDCPHADNRAACWEYDKAVKEKGDGI